MQKRINSELITALNLQQQEKFISDCLRSEFDGDSNGKFAKVELSAIGWNMSYRTAVNSQLYLTVRNLVFLKNLIRIASAFNTNSIDFIVLKGCAYIIDTQNIDERSFVDIDILIKRNDLQKAKKVLNEIGYVQQQYSHSDQTDPRFNIERGFYNKEVYIDLHFSLIQQYKNIALDYGKIFSNSRKIGKCNISALSHEDALWFVIEHAFRHAFDREQDYIDFMKYVEKYGAVIDWNLFLKKIEKRQLKTASYFFLQKCKESYGVHLPDTILKSCKPNFVTRLFFNKVTRGINELSTANKNRGKLRQNNMYKLCPNISIRGILASLCEDQFLNKYKRLMYILFPSISHMKLIYHLDPKAKLPAFLYFTRLFQFMIISLKKMSRLKGYCF